MSLPPLDARRSGGAAPARRDPVPALAGLAAFLLVLSFAAALDSLGPLIDQETQKVGLPSITLIVILACRFAVPTSELDAAGRARREGIRRGAIGGAVLGIVSVASIAAITSIGG